MDEFAQSRYRLEARYHHVLVDEFQDTSAAQWRLVANLIAAWGEGAGLAQDTGLQPSIFVVGDRKQSIYAFRDAEVRVFRTARRHVARLRETGDVRRALSHSFRAAPALLAFANDLFDGVEKNPKRDDAFRYGTRDRFPVAWDGDLSGAGAVGLVVGDGPRPVAEAVAVEVERLLAGTVVGDRQTGLRRNAEPGDIAILFRTRASHREFEQALTNRDIPTYVYKGLGFFDADETKDVVALLRYLAEPVVGSARGGLSALAVRAAVGPGRPAARSPTRARVARPGSAARGRQPERRGPRRAGTRARVCPGVDRPGRPCTARCVSTESSATAPTRSS